MAWHEILATGIILAGTAFYCWAAYSRKSGPTSCIGCGKCVADGVCILTGKKVLGFPEAREKTCDFPVDNRAETFIIIVSENSKSYDKASFARPAKREGRRCEPLAHAAEQPLWSGLRRAGRLIPVSG